MSRPAGQEAQAKQRKLLIAALAGCRPDSNLMERLCRGTRSVSDSAPVSACLGRYFQHTSQPDTGLVAVDAWATKRTPDTDVKICDGHPQVEMNGTWDDLAAAGQSGLMCLCLCMYIEPWRAEQFNTEGKSQIFLLLVKLLPPRLN